MDKTIKRAAENFIKNIKNTEIIIDSVIYDKCYKVKYQEKYFDGGGYCWSNIRGFSITEKELSPYLIDEQNIKLIIYYLKNDHPSASKLEDIVISSVIKKTSEYLVEYQGKYFDGGGKRWTDIILSGVEKSDINTYLRNEKIEKIKERT